MDTWEAVLPRRAHFNARREALRAMAAEIGAQVVDIDAGYFVHDDRPEIVIETLRELVESTRARASEQRDKAGATAGPNG